MRYSRLLGAGLLLMAVSLLRAASPSAAMEKEMNAIAENYVKLCLAVGVHDGDYVDAYFGPAEWRTEAEQKKLPLADIAREAHALRERVQAVALGEVEPLWQLRREYLTKQLRAMEGRVAYLRGNKAKFDDESAVVYDAVAPHFPEAHFERLVAELDHALPPGSGSLAERLEAFRSGFVIPREKLDAVFQTAIRTARERTRAHARLPEGESFVVEYVTDKPWGGYNWYKGDFHSVIQVNTDLPIFIDRALDLACHEGYPGHHVYNVLLEKNLLRGRGWVEFSVYPLFSPQSLIAEGTANFGISVAFPPRERMVFEREVLFPLAGIDSKRADDYYRVLNLTKELAFAGNEAARRYLDGEIDADAAANWLVRYALMAPARAKQRMKFIEKYRSYVINYNYGEKLVGDYISARAGDDVEKRWAEFLELISTPRLPASLR